MKLSKSIVLKQFKPFIKYCIVGFSGTVVDLASLYLFVEYLGIAILPAATLSFLLAVVNNFILNKIWTFQNKSKNYRKLFIKFLLVSTVGLSITLGLMHVFTEIAGIWYMLAKIFTSAFVLIWNFLANKLWTFRQNKKSNLIHKDPSYDLSIVIPAYNEEKRIKSTLKKIHSYIKQEKLNAEIIVVNDGSKDRTAKVVNSCNYPNLKLVTYKKNKGKGYAVKRGVMEAQGSYILFTDADNSTPIEEFSKLKSNLHSTDATIAIGSRYISENSVKRKQPFYRVLIGRIGNFFIQLFLIEGIKDTQCGFKLFENRAAKEIFHLQKIERWGFDIEALAVAKTLNYKIIEVPVHWYNSEDSRIRPIRDALNTFKELLLIKLNVICGRYIPE